jgi:hypothetical protein
LSNIIIRIYKYNIRKHKIEKKIQTSLRCYWLK